jgi:hypothetical protein
MLKRRPEVVREFLNSIMDINDGFPGLHRVRTFCLAVQSHLRISDDDHQISFCVLRKLSLIS